MIGDHRNLAMLLVFARAFVPGIGKGLYIMSHLIDLNLKSSKD